MNKIQSIKNYFSFMLNIEDNIRSLNAKVLHLEGYVEDAESEIQERLDSAERFSDIAERYKDECDDMRNDVEGFTSDSEVYKDEAENALLKVKDIHVNIQKALVDVKDGKVLLTMTEDEFDARVRAMIEKTKLVAMQ
jgi:chromosome segregation ATPase